MGRLFAEVLQNPALVPSEKEKKMKRFWLSLPLDWCFLPQASGFLLRSLTAFARPLQGYWPKPTG